MDLTGDERGRLDRAAGWLRASRGETIGLAVLLVGTLVATVAVVWSALGRPALPVADDATVAAVGDDPDTVADADDAPGDGHDHDHGDDGGEVAADPVDTEVVVHVGGAVGAPGVVTLAAGSRVLDAIDAAGGLDGDADVSQLNLARPLVDGERVWVVRDGEDPPPDLAAPPGDTPAGGTPSGGAPGESGGAGGGPIDLNRADVAALQTLPGVGPAIAERIVRHREQHGPFQQIGDLRDVSGIGERRFQDLADLVTVG